ncbi:hypothetical protein [Halomarina pelagica]|uniref:hypothetical protein n=1 Tax=Halomarina pelagica TaxID=2961599 RepID=UPI0020C46F92|nr:hypothetical protein [Halomarina sp. BND7]
MAGSAIESPPAAQPNSSESVFDRVYCAGAYARGHNPDEGRTLKSGQMAGRFGMMVQVAVTLAVGVLVLGQIFNALPETSGPLSNASAQVESLTATAFELAPIVLIVVVAALVLNVIRGI